MLKSYVISLASSEKRREHINSEFGRAKINFEFFDAVTPDIIDAVAQDLNVNIKNLDLTNGEKACLLSHLSLWQKAVDDKLDYIAIFEDDVILGKDIATYFQDVRWIPKQCDIVKIEYFETKALMGFKTIFLPKFRKLRQLQGQHLGAAGYILSLNTAVDLMKLVQADQNMVAVDHILFDQAVLQKRFLIYQMTPALCIQSDRRSSNDCLVSSLEAERRKRFNYKFEENKKIKLDLKQKLRREALRLWMQFRSLLSKQSFR